MINRVCIQQWCSIFGTIGPMNDMGLVCGPDQTLCAGTGLHALGLGPMHLDWTPGPCATFAEPHVMDQDYGTPNCFDLA